MRRSLFVSLGLCVLTFGFYVASWGQAPAPAELGKLVAQDAEYIQTTLAKVDFDKDKKALRDLRKIRVTALMIAQYAQSGIAKDNPKNGSLATLRDQSLLLIKTLATAKPEDRPTPAAVAEARKIAAKLSLDIAVNPAAKTDPVALIKLDAFENVMSQFSSVRLGGFGLDDALDELKGINGPVTDEQSAKARLLAQKLSMIASLSQTHVPAKLDAKRNLEAWKGFAQDMFKSSHDLADAAKKKNGPAIGKAAIKLGNTCEACHEVFRAN